MAMASPALGHVFPCLLYACTPFCKQKWKAWDAWGMIKTVYCNSNLSVER